MTHLQQHERLAVYQLAHQLAIDIHKMTIHDLPRFERHEQASQIRRSSKGVVANLVEGYGRKQHQHEFARYVTLAIGSCNETRSHLQLLFDTGSLQDELKFRTLLNGYENLGRHLFRFRAAIQSQSKSVLSSRSPRRSSGAEVQGRT